MENASCFDQIGKNFEVGGYLHAKLHTFALKRRCMEFDFYVHAAALSKVFFFQPAGAAQLVEAAGGVKEVFRMGRKVFAEMAPGCAQLADELFDGSLLEWAAKEIEWCASSGIKPLCRDDAEYPKRLAECPDAPVILYVLGDADLNARRMLSVVGTRRSTFYGRGACRDIVLNLRSHCGDVTVVSGLAFGIDAQAHTSSIEAGLPTIAALPTGLDTIYPQAHRELAKRILAEGGALVTDFPRGSASQPVQFLRRNRIIAGMTDCCLLVESFEKGGGLITTSLADSYSREVAAVPGRISDPSFAGCNNLISSNQAHLATCAADIALLMGWKEPETGKRGRRRVSGQLSLQFEDADPCRKAVIGSLKASGQLSFDEIVRAVSAEADIPGNGFSVPEISCAVTSLEVDGIIVNNAGRLYELA